jgi:hypothetical protein
LPAGRWEPTVGEWNCRVAGGRRMMCGAALAGAIIAGRAELYAQSIQSDA